MFKLFLNDISNSKTFTLFGLAILFLLIMLVDNSNALMLSLVIGLLIIFVAIGYIIILKVHDEKNNTDKFLTQLPINKYKIQFSRALFLLVSIMIFTIIPTFMLMKKVDASDINQYIQVFIIISGNVSLVICGIASLLMVFLNISKIKTILEILIPAFITLIIVFLFFSKNNGIVLDFSLLDNIILQSNGFVISILGFFAFILLNIVISYLRKRAFL